MNRLIRVVAVLPFLTLMMVSLYDVANGREIDVSYEWLMLCLFCNVAGILKLEHLRDGIKGILYSGVIANALLYLTKVLGETHSKVTVLIFVSYMLFTYFIAILDLINARYLKLNALDTPLHSNPEFEKGMSYATKNKSTSSRSEFSGDRRASESTD